MFMDAIHVHAKKGKKHDEVRGSTPLAKMTAYEWCMKTSAMLNPPTLNRLL